MSYVPSGYKKLPGSDLYFNASTGQYGLFPRQPRYYDAPPGPEGGAAGMIMQRKATSVAEARHYAMPGTSQLYSEEGGAADWPTPTAQGPTRRTGWGAPRYSGNALSSMTRNTYATSRQIASARRLPAVSQASIPRYIQGVPGKKGASYGTGTAGKAGTGISGKAGTGISGTSTKGATGLSGGSGIQGTSGTTAISGTKGTVGTQGTVTIGGVTYPAGMKISYTR